MSDDLTKLQTKRNILKDLREKRSQNKQVSYLRYLKENNYTKFLKVKGLIEKGLNH